MVQYRSVHNKILSEYRFMGTNIVNVKKVNGNLCKGYTKMIKLSKSLEGRNVKVTRGKY